MPAFLIPVAAWILEKFGTKIGARAYKLAAAAFYMTTFMASLAALAVFTFAMPSPPAAMTTAMSILAPSDWAGQLAAVVSARVLSLAFHAFKQAYFIAQS